MRIKALLEEQEVWKLIRGWPKYEVSTLGEIRLTDTHQLVPQWNHTGRDTTYKRVTLRQGGRRKNFRVHRLVAAAFIPNPERLPEVDHKDGDPFNNNVNNLEWVTASQNRYRQWNRDNEDEAV